MDLNTDGSFEASDLIGWADVVVEALCTDAAVVVSLSFSLVGMTYFGFRRCCDTFLGVFRLILA